MEIEQTRVPGFLYRDDGSIFDPTQAAGVHTFLDGAFFTPDGGNVLDWTNLAGGSPFGANASPTYITGGLNGRTVMRLNPGSEQQFFYSAFGTYAVRELWMVLKIREETFSNFGGIFTDNIGDAILVGTETQTRFFDLEFGDGYSYQLDGVSHAEDAQAAPMDAWGLVHVKLPAAASYGRMQIGRDRDYTSGRFGKFDVASVVVTGDEVAESDAALMDQFLNRRWALPE